MFLMDTSVLSHLLSARPAGKSSSTLNEPSSECAARIQHFIKSNNKKKILISTPTLCEFLIYAKDKHEEVLQALKVSSAFKVVPFDEVCAQECFLLEREARLGGNKRGNAAPQTPWQKVKFDRQILATALAHGVSAIYSDDADIRNLAQLVQLPCYGISDMPLPETERQGRLHLIEPVTAEEEAEADS